jgi:hypothetical protein
MQESVISKDSVWLGSKATQFFWFGFIVYMVSLAFPGELLLSVKITQVFQLLGILIFLPAAIFLINWKETNKLLAIIIFLFLLWSFLIIVRGFTWDVEFFKRLLFIAPFSVFGFLAPFVLFFPNKLFQIRNVFSSAIIIALFFLVYDVIFFRVIIEGEAQHRLPIEITGKFLTFLAIPSGFVLLNYYYHKPKVNLFALLVISLAFFIALIRARRGLLLNITLILLTSYLIFVIHGKGRLLKIFLSFIMLLFLIILGRELFLYNPGDMFGLIIERFGEDTRGWVERSFYQDMGGIDWIIGRGINGQYYCPGLDEVEGTVTVYRLAIEKGYLQVVLRGG